jgi:hypothetical protein
MEASKTGAEQSGGGKRRHLLRNEREDEDNSKSQLSKMMGKESAFGKAICKCRNNNSNKLCRHVEEQVRMREQVQRTSENLRTKAKRAQRTGEECLQQRTS